MHELPVAVVKAASVVRGKDSGASGGEQRWKREREYARYGDGVRKMVEGGEGLWKEG
jgi:hypothetical protein